MKIGIYTISTYPHLGGMTSHMQELQAGINSLEHEAHCFGFPIPAIINAPKKAYHKRKDELTERKSFYIISGLFLLSRALFFIVFMNFYLLYKQVTQSYDAYMAQDVIAFHSSLLVRLLFRKRVTLTVHGYYVDEKVADDKIQQKSVMTKVLYTIEHSAYKNAPKIFSVDERIKNYVKKVLRTDPGIVIIKNFVNTESFKPKKTKKSDKFTILCARRFVEKNGVVYAVEAMKYLPKGYELLLAGEGQTKSDIDRIIKTHNLKNVKYLGGKRREEMPDLLNKSHVAIVPSISIKGVEEATSISALEAMSCGIPVIASNIGGLKEIVINNETGFLVNDKRPKQIAEAIKKLRNNPRLREKMGANARETVSENYSHTKGAKEYLRHVIRKQEK